MEQLTHVWRPHDSIRVTALAIAMRQGRILVSQVTNDTGDRVGWRPLGGGLDFGETAADAATREMQEEIQAVFHPKRQLGVLENRYTHHGQNGHEIVFVIQGDLVDPGQAKPDQFVMEDGLYRNLAEWIPMANFRDGTEILLPSGLLGLIDF